MQVPCAAADVPIPSSQANVASWYNYYTRRDGELEHDVLNEVTRPAALRPPPRPDARVRPER
jgi:hypothetical protein